MKNFGLIKSGLKIKPLLDAIERQPHLWEEIKVRQDYKDSAHKYTESIFLRWCKELTVSAAFKDLKSMKYPAWDKLPEAVPLIEQVLELVGSIELGRVLIVNLKPGAEIAPHCDEGEVAAHFERFHVPLYSDHGNEFHCENENVHMGAGELWVFNNKKEHWLKNGSANPRIHLIVDAVSTHFRKVLNEV